MSYIEQILQGPTVDAKLVHYRGHATGFDYLRLFLSLAVVFWHSFLFSYGAIARKSELHVVALLILPMFFALSGFLVSRSLVRSTSIREFLLLRGIRIFPALIVEVTLSACLIGAAFTTLPLGRYFHSAKFHSYFWNVIGQTHFFLPGVFTTNPETLFNASLWTIPYEIQFYAFITLLWLVGAIKSRRWLVFAAVAVQLAIPAYDLARGRIPNLGGQLTGRVLILSFLGGVLIYFFRERIVLRGWMASVAAMLALALLSSPLTSYFVALPAAYLTVFLGLTNPPKIPVLMGGDYSYGIYLYAAPIQQAVVHLFPHHREWWFVFGASLVPVFLAAAFSWHVIEKGIMARRRYFVELSARAAFAFARRPAPAT